MPRPLYSVTCLPAGHGDSILIAYGDPDEPSRILIDGGPASSYDGIRTALENLPAGARKFELLVISHIDADHIDGVLILLQDEQLGVSFNDVWFNGWPQLESLSGRTPPDNFAPQQGEFLGALIHEQGLSWNSGFGDDHGPVVVPDSGTLPTRQLPGGAKLTLLSPLRADLLKLRKSWTKALSEAGLRPGDWEQARARLSERKEYKPRVARDDVFAAKTFGTDGSVANGTSIAFVLEYQGRRVLFGADAHVSVLNSGLRRVAAEQQVPRVSLDAVKLAHHGSMANIDGQFLDVTDASRFLVSTNGDHFHHPDPQTIRLLAERVPGAEVRFNYRSSTTEVWAEPDAEHAPGIRAVYPPEGQLLDLMS